MKKIFIALSLFFVVVCFAGCAESKQKEEKKEYSVEQINQDLLDAASQLEKSEQLYFDNGLEISGLGVTYDGRPTEFDGCYYWPAIEKMTNAHVDIDWHDAEGYSSSVATTLLMDISQLPDIVNPFSFGIMDLADDGLIVPLDDYLELMPDIVAAVGEERMDNWRQADGHIYYIPTVSSIQGSQSMMVRQDWLDELNMDVPETWEDWLALWRGIRASADCQFCVLDDGTYTMVYEHPKYEEFLQAVSDLYKEGIIKDDFNTYDYNKIEEMMRENLLGTTMTWAVSSSNAEYLRENGDADALWVATAPVQGPDGNQMIQERELISSSWCITARAKEEEKVEDIVRFFNWCFTQEGAYLYNYGIEGVSYEMVEDKPVLNADLIADSFTDYRAVGCNFEPFGGLWLEDAFMQCLFSGKTENELDEITAESFKGLFEVNDDYFYTQPVTFETNAYVKYRSNLITAGICPLRDQAIRGEITVEEFAQKYKELKEQGLNKVIKEAEAISKKN